jgi:hypothetical protein
MTEDSRGGFLCVLASLRETWFFSGGLRASVVKKQLPVGSSQFSVRARLAAFGFVRVFRVVRGEKKLFGDRLDSQSCETNPIRSGVGFQGPEVSDLAHPGNAWQRPSNRPPAPNKPNLATAEGRISAVWITSCAEWDTPEAVDKQTQFGGPATLGEEKDKARDRHGRDGRGTGTPNAIDRVWEPPHGQSLP